MRPCRVTAVWHLSEALLRWLVTELVEADKVFCRDVFDHADIIGAQTSLGAPVSVQMLAGVPAGEAHFVLGIRGATGWLSLVRPYLAWP